MKPVRTLLAVALALAAAPSFAQTYSQTVFFGDSLTDSGFYRPFLVQQNPLASGLGKFTTNPGLVWSEYLANFYGTSAAPAWGLTATGIVNATGSNFAAGGARINAQPGFPPTPPTSFAPSLSQQTTAYLARNGGRADPDALYTVWGGANDLFFTLNGLSTQAQFLAAASQEVALVSTLRNAGARYVMVATVPDVGQTPFGLSQGAAGSAGITALVGAYNQTLFGGLAQGGLRVIPLNTFTLLREVSATPAAFGFNSVTLPACGATSSLVCGPGNYPAGGDFSFAFADGVHPTTGGHEILADYAVSILEGPRYIAGLPNSATMTGRARADRVAGHLGGKPDADGMRWWSDLRGDFSRHGEGAYFDGEGPAITVGVDRASGDFVFGGFAGYGRQERIWDGDSGFDQSEATLGGFAGWYGGNAWISGQVSYTGLSFEIDRRVQLGRATRSHTGSPDGSNLSVGGSGGWVFGDGALRHGPVVSVLSQTIEIDGYAENDASLSTSLAYPDQEYDSLIASAGWQLSYVADENFKPYARVTLDREFEDDAVEAFATSQSMAGSGQYAVPGLEFDHDYGTILLGARTRLFGLDTNFGTSVTLGQTTGRQATVFVNVGSRF